MIYLKNYIISVKIMILVNQTYQNDLCSITVHDKGNEYFYAYYIYNNKKCIERVMYSSNKTIDLQTIDFKGVIQIQVFLKNKKTREVVSEFLKPIKIKREKVNLEELSVLHDLDQDVVVDGCEIPVLLKKKESAKKLFIFLNGSVSLKTQEVYYPYFSRVPLSDKFEGNCLYIYDQSLNMEKNYTLGWYRGVGECSLHDKYIKLIQKFIDELGIKYKDVVFYGSSGGGFAALKFAESFPKSTAVAINPQINCLAYNNIKAVEKFKDTFLDYSDKSQVEIDSSKFSKRGAKFIIVQNKQDIDHYENHFKPFWKRISRNTEGYDSAYHNYALLYDHESGHGGEPLEVFEQVKKLLN